MKLLYLFRRGTPPEPPENTGILHRIDRDRYGLEPEASELYQETVRRIVGETDVPFVDTPRCYAWYLKDEDLSALPGSVYDPGTNSVILREDAIEDQWVYAHELGHALQRQQLEVHHGTGSTVSHCNPDRPLFHSEGFACWIADSVAARDSISDLEYDSDEAGRAAAGAGETFFTAVEERNGRQIAVETGIKPLNAATSFEEAGRVILEHTSDDTIRSYVQTHLL